MLAKEEEEQGLFLAEPASSAAQGLQSRTGINWYRVL